MNTTNNPPPQQWASGGAASLYLVGALHVGIFAYATGQVPPNSAPLLGFWILGCSVSLLLLAMVELKRGEILFGTIGMVFGGLLGLGGSFSFIRTMWNPVIYAMDGWWFASAGLIIFCLLAAVRKYSWILFAGLAEVGVTLVVLGVGMIGANVSLVNLAGWGALVFTVFCWYAASAQMINTVYQKQILPL